MSYGTIVNLTPHAVNIFLQDDVYYSSECRAYIPFEGKKPYRVFEASDAAARCILEESESELIDGIASCVVSPWTIVGLPDAVPGIVYIVSSIVGRHGAHEGRTDLVIPHGIVKNVEGITIGCTKLAFIRPYVQTLRKE